MDEKRELLQRLSKLTDGAPEMLQSRSRRELLQMLCTEVGKDRKYTGLTKIKMIEHLLKLMSNKNSADNTNGTGPSSSLTNSISSKRQRKNNNPVRMTIPANYYVNEDREANHFVFCQNLACRAVMKSGESFCKRCSCCICFKYDDNKDPSLWLECNSEPPYEGNSCGMSCHLVCALKNDKCGIAVAGSFPRLDGGFFCFSCNKVNDLLGCWKKQLMIAKETRRVDILCYRIFLSSKLLTGTEKYQTLHKLVVVAVEKLKDEVGDLDGLPGKMARGIVNRLSCGAEVQRLCAVVVEMLNSWQSSNLVDNRTVNDGSISSQFSICFEDPSPSSIMVVFSYEDGKSSNSDLTCSLWHRRADAIIFPEQPTCSLQGPKSIFLLKNLTPATDYVVLVTTYCNGAVMGNKEASFRTTKDFKKSIADATSDGDESYNAGNTDLNKLTVIVSEQKFGTSNDEDPDGEALQDDSVSVLDEEGTVVADECVPNSGIRSESQRDSINSSDENQASNEPKTNNGHPESQLHEEMSMENECDANPAENAHLHQSQMLLLATPCKQESSGDGTKGNCQNWLVEPEKQPQAGSSSRKRGVRKCGDTCISDGSPEGEYEYCVKVIRWLERERFIEKNYRMKFLTWFSLRATIQERRVVSAYIGTLIDDPASLAGQLVDTFSEGFCSKRPPPAQSGICLKLWH